MNIDQNQQKIKSKSRSRNPELQLQQNRESNDLDNHYVSKKGRISREQRSKARK